MNTEPRDSFDRMEHTMKDAFASFQILTKERAKELGIHEWVFWDIKNRLIRQGFKIEFTDRLGEALKISRRSQQKLISQGYSPCDIRE